MKLLEEELLQNVMLSVQVTFNIYPALKDMLAKEEMKVRFLHSSDFLKGYFDLISQTTDTRIEDHTEAKFQEYFEMLHQNSGSYYVVVIESEQRIIGSCVLVVEQKFIHETALRGRIEDLHVLKEFQGKGLNSLLVECLTLLARRVGCYKTTLNSKQEDVDFYSRLNYKEEGQQNFMVNTIRDTTINNNS